LALGVSVVVPSVTVVSLKSAAMWSACALVSWVVVAVVPVVVSDGKLGYEGTAVSLPELTRTTPHQLA